MSLKASHLNTIVLIRAPIMATVRTPSVLWAQRTSLTAKKHNFVYLTIVVPEIIHSTLNYTVTTATISLTVNAKGDEGCRYGFELEFYSEVNPMATKTEIASIDCVNLLIFKKDIDLGHWPRLSKDILDFVKPNISKKIEEGAKPDLASRMMVKSILDHVRIMCFNPVGVPRAYNHPQKGRSTTTVQAGRLDWLLNLGSSYFGRFEHDGDLADIKCAISHLQQAIHLILTDHPNLPSRLNNLGICFTCSFEHTGDIIDINTAIYHQQRAVQLTPEGHDGLPSRLINLGNSLTCRFEHTGDFGDLDSAISYLEQAMHLTPIDDANLLPCLNNLGNALVCRFERKGNLDDLNSAISHYQQVADRTPTGHACLPARLSNLGISFTRRFEHTGNFTDIDSAITHQHRAVQLTPVGHTDLLSRLNNLGGSYVRRFEHTGALPDINSAISYQQQATQLIPADHAHLPSILSNLGSSFLRRFEHTGDLEDINSAISNRQQAVQLTPAGHAHLPSMLSTLGGSYLRRFQRAGDLIDIDSAISYQHQAMKLTPNGHADFAFLYNALGSSYLCRFERTGDLADLDFSISQQKIAVELTPADHVTDLASHLNNLAISLTCRFKLRQEPTDIESAISHHQRAVQLTPPGNVNLSSRLSNLGGSYFRRFEQTQELADIDASISLRQHAVQSTPAGHAYLPIFLNNLGGSYLCRFGRTGELTDIESAISYHQQAVELTPAEHANLPSHLNDLGDSFRRRFQHTGDLSDIRQATIHYCRGAQASGSPFKRLECAKHAATLSRKLDSVSSIPDFSLSIALLAEVAGLEQTIHRRHRNIFEHSDFVSHAVATALENNCLDQAVEWLEQGRCLVWNQIGQLRTPVDRLRDANPSLADHFATLASTLEFLSTRSVVSNQLSSLDLEDASRIQEKMLLHTRAAQDYKQALEKIRCLVGFEDFFQPPKAISILSSLPPEGPMILFNIHADRCDVLALIKGSSSPRHIPLNDFTHDIAKALRETMQSDVLNHQRGRDPTRGAVDDLDSAIFLVLEVLWYKVVEPILDALAYTVPSDRSDRPRIWWCPSGPLSFLPLHAAGIYNSQSQSCVTVSDYVVSSYTPTARSVTEKFAKTSAVSTTTSLLLVSQPNTPGLSSIPSTRQETCELKDMMQKHGFGISLLEDANATRDKVKEELNSHTWAHFACHGVQDPEHPLESGLCLHDGRLELLEIMKQRIENPKLVFLSACQTGTGDIKLSEEVVHLAASMLAAGYQGVVGTMWNISDRHGPQFAMEFYRYLLDRKGPNGLDSTLAAYALDHATAEVRKSLGITDVSFLMWVPYVHYGY